jgi:hypothetical protein
MNEMTSVGSQLAGFDDRCIVSCGMLHPELTHLVETGFIFRRLLAESLHDRDGTSAQ